MSRLFIAAVPPADVLDVIESLDRPAEDGVRYTTRAQWHVTLRFLGEADEHVAIAALGEVDTASGEARIGPTVSRLGRDVVIIPVEGLKPLAGAVAVATSDVGEPPDPRPFTGHLTIARLRRRGACRVAGQSVGGSFRVHEIHLIRSDLRPGGAQYESIATQPLR